MSVLPHNDFYSFAVPNVSSLESDPSVVLGADEIVDCGHIAIISIVVGNKSLGDRLLTLTIEKAEQEESCEMFSGVIVPFDRPYDLMREGSKIFLNKGDVIKAWTDQSDSLDLLVSYAVYTPSSLV